MDRQGWLEPRGRRGPLGAGNACAERTKRTACLARSGDWLAGVFRKDTPTPFRVVEATLCTKMRRTKKICKQAEFKVSTGNLEEL